MVSLLCHAHFLPLLVYRLTIVGSGQSGKEARCATPCFACAIRAVSSAVYCMFTFNHLCPVMLTNVKAQLSQVGIAAVAG